MADKVVIALDAMGGDKAPNIVIDGACRFLKKNKDKNVYFKIFGNKDIIEPLIKKGSILIGNYDLTHTESKISSNDKPSEALRNGRESSMRLAINCVKNDEAKAVISAGNTGALMAISKFVLNTIEGIDRPAICTFVPTRKNPCVLLDLGANSQCSKEQLLQFAIMGDAFVKSVLNTQNPKIGLLNIGSESIKGNELVQQSAELISQNKNINYIGFAEGDDIFTGNFDVIVTDGFTGNVALKVLEGTAKFIKFKLSLIFKNSIFAKIGLGLLFLLSATRIIKIVNEIDPRNYNGAMMIGLKGISIKSHGSADKKSFASAILVAYKLIISNVNEKISTQLVGNKE
jgi:glycerol-3-phosphate acyltransferase PlsX